MEPSQSQLFQSDNLIPDIHESINSPRIYDPADPILSEIDQHMVDIVAAYIRRLPDKMIRKHIARFLINTIIKSANL